MRPVLVTALVGFFASMGSAAPATPEAEADFDIAALVGAQNWFHETVNATDIELIDDSSHHLTARHKLTCHNRDWWGAQRGPIIEGIEYLRGVGGKPTLPAHSCERVSCSWGSAIGWCNDDDKTRSLPSFINISQGARVILNGCSTTDYFNFAGELDHPDKWRVIVVHDGYKC
ncbi:hypothetical protein BJX61DRAFT_546373 [Aspergillus egyptiacus]|nr:hypothetical protein BJX61DRAFT_546373 [Aspergillus egyptiacus]